MQAQSLTSKLIMFITLSFCHYGERVLSGPLKLGGCSAETLEKYSTAHTFLLSFHPGVHFHGNSITNFTGLHYLYERLSTGKVPSDKFLSKFTTEQLKTILAWKPTDAWRAERDTMLYEIRKAGGEAVMRSKGYSIDPVTGVNKSNHAMSLGEATMKSQGFTIDLDTGVSKSNHALSMNKASLDTRKANAINRSGGQVADVRCKDCKTIHKGIALVSLFDYRLKDSKYVCFNPMKITCSKCGGQHSWVPVGITLSLLKLRFEGVSPKPSKEDLLAKKKKQSSRKE